MVISDLIDYSKKLYSMTDFIQKYQVKTIFLEYARVCIKINKYLNWRDTPEYREPRPKNSFLNSILSVDLKGVSNMYKLILPKGNQILGELTDKWRNKTELEFSNFKLQKSFHLHHTSFKDCYLKYTQFRTLHRRFFTNDKLHKMGIKPSDQCSFCKASTDSVDHMILYCTVVQELWANVNNWLIEIGFLDYNLSDSRNVLGDLENGPIVNSIILITKKVIYDSFKKEKNLYLFT